MRLGPSLLLLVIASCTEASTPAEPPSTPEPVGASRPATPPEPDPVVEPPSVPPKTSPPTADRIACTADADCVSSCTHGAVNGDWHARRYPGGEACEDGCTRKGTDPPRCEHGECVAYHQGARDEACTRVDAEVVPAPGPAHRCARDEDCTQTCALGAVNRQWLSWQSDPPQCKDGCTAKGTEDPRCEAGLCVAYRLGKRNEHCTAKPIPRP